jgi:hypothetical protein
MIITLLGGFRSFSSLFPLLKGKKKGKGKGLGEIENSIPFFL